MNVVPLQLMASLLLGTCFTTHVEALEKSKSKQKQAQTSKKVSEKQLESWINLLSEESFRDRRAASNNLLKAGKQALPFLVNGALRNDAELSVRCVDIISKMYQGENEALIFAAKKTSSESENGSKRSVTQRVKIVTQQILVENAIVSIKKLGGIVTLDKSGKVRIVKLSNDKVTDSELVLMKEFPSLQILSLYNSEITDTALVRLKGMTSLRWLSLGNAKITDAGLIHLKGFTKLETLNLWNTQVTTMASQI